MLFKNLIISFKGYEKQIQVTTPGIGTVIPFVKNYNNKIKLEYPHCPGEGIIWFNPSSNEIKVNLNQTYEWKYDYYESYSKYYSILSSDKNKIIYSVENAEKDACRLEHDLSDASWNAIKRYYTENFNK